MVSDELLLIENTTRKDILMEKYSFAMNDEAKEPLSKQIEDLKAPAEPNESVI